MDIEMQTFAGELNTATKNEQSNSYQRETHFDDVSVDQGILQDIAQSNEAQTAAPQQAVEKEPSAQELNFKALREEVDKIKAERDEFRQNLELLRANVQQQPAPRQEEPKKFLDGMGDHDIPNVSEIRQAFEQREAQYQMRLEELQVQQSHPDYAEVLEKYTAPLLKQKPHLAEGIYGARNKALYAYELGKMAQGQYQPPVQIPTQQSSTAQRIVENARKPGNIAQTGGQSTLSQADYYATMSDQEFMKFAGRHLEGI